MVEDGDPSQPDNNLTKLLPIIAGTEILDEESLHRPLWELLENTFQTLDTAYKAGNFQEYDRIEADFIRQFTLFWRYRIQKYNEIASREPLGSFGRYMVEIGGDFEEMKIEIRPGFGLDLDLETAPKSVVLRIFRAELGGQHYDSLEIEGFPFKTSEGVFYTRLKLDSTIKKGGFSSEVQEYPSPSRFHLKLIGEKIDVLQRTTVRYYTNEKGRILGRTRVESISPTSGR